MGLGSLQRPSPAMVVAVIALLLALVGTAVAGGGAGTSSVVTKKLDKKEKKQVKKIAKKEANKLIKQKVPNLAQRHAPRAWATVDAITDPARLEAQYPPRGFDAVEEIDVGTYCLTPDPEFQLDPASDPLIVTAEWTGTIGIDVIAFWAREDNGIDCSNENDFTVVTYARDAGTGELEPSGDVSFLVMVP
jgi:hypothetical protein